MFVCSHAYELLSIENFNSSLVAFILNYLIAIGEFHYFFIWGPELYLSIFSSSSLHLVLPQKVFVVKSIEVCAFSLVGVGRGVAEHVSVGVVPSVVVVPL